MRAFEQYARTYVRVICFQHTKTTNLFAKGSDIRTYIALGYIVDGFQSHRTKVVLSFFFYTTAARRQEFLEENKRLEEQTVSKKKNRMNGFHTNGFKSTS